MDLCKLDRTVLGEHASPGLVDLLEGALETALNHEVIKAAIKEPEAPIPQEEAPEPIPAPPKPEAQKPGKGGKKAPAKPAAKSKVPEPEPVVEPVIQELQPPPPPVLDEYSERIDDIKAQCEKRISESLELERYLKSQHEKAEQDRAADFDAKDREFSRFWRYAAAPHIPPPLELDKSKLQPAGLLHHRDILDTVQNEFRKNYLDPLKHKEFSGGTDAPHYLAQTAANENRAQTRASMVSKCKQAIAEGSAFKWHTLSPERLQAELKASRDREILNRRRMNGDQWDAERKVIERMQRRLQYVRNPRYEMRESKKKDTYKRDPLLNRPKFGSRSTVSKRTPALTSQAGVAFVCEPPIISISSWEVGKTYNFPFKVRNVSHTLQQMRVLPLLSKHFHVSQAALPGPTSVIAPGMHASLSIKFTPDSLHNFTESLTLLTPLGKISVPLRAVRDAPTLDLPKELDLGPEYVGGNTVTKTVTVTANKGSGAFRIMAAVDWAEGAVHPSSSGAIELPNGFSIEPTEFSLSAGCQQLLKFSFRPTSCGMKTTTFVAVCDNCTVHEFILRAEGIQPDAWINSIDGKLCQDQLPDPFTFPPTIPGSMNKRTITICNRGSAALPFKWLLEDSGDSVMHSAAAPSAHSETPGEQTSESTADGAHFMIIPSEGVLRAGEEVHFEAVYAPIAQGRSSVCASFMVIPCASAPAAASHSQSDLMHEAIVQQQLVLEGSGVRHPATVTPHSLVLTRPLHTGTAPVQTLFIRNPCRVPAHYTISKGDQRVVLSSDSGVVQPHTNESITVKLLPGDSMHQHSTITCSIKHGCTHNINVAACYADPVAHWLTPALDMGIVLAGSASECIIRVRNPCDTAPAPWAASVGLTAAPGTNATAHVEFPKESSGHVPPGETIQVPVRCTVQGTGLMSGLLRLDSNSQTSLIPVCVETVAPVVSVLHDKGVVHFGAMYEGFPVQQVFSLQNSSRVPAKWNVREQSLLGQGCDLLSVKVEPPSGEISAWQTQEVTIQGIAHGIVDLDCVLAFDVENSNTPVVLSLLGSVKHMSVQYSIEACLPTQTEVQLLEDPGSKAKMESDRLKAALEHKRLDFGNEIAVGDTVELKLTVSNDTYIESVVNLKVVNFAAQEPAGSASATCGQNSQGGRRKGKMLLSDQHEVLTPFRAAAGNDMLTNRRAKDVADSVLDNRGMAISITPRTAVLPSFGTVTFTLKLMSNMIGTYEDILECCVGAQPPQQFLVRAGIIGSPVHLQKEASLVRGLNVWNQTRAKVGFGIVPKGVQVTRAVSVFNLSCFEVAIAFHLEVFERSQERPWMNAQLQVQPDESISLNLRHNSIQNSEAQSADQKDGDHSKVGPFSITPASVLLKSGASERITITFASDATHTHEAILHGKQTLRYNAPAVSVSLREAPGAAAATQDSAEKGTGGSAPSGLAELFLRGAFHPHAAPPPKSLLPLTVALAANCKPCTLLCEEGPPVLWCVHSTHGKGASVFERTFTLCNTGACPLRFSLRTNGPFQVIESIPSVPQDKLRWAGCTFFPSRETGWDRAHEEYFLPPMESIEVSARFNKPKKQDNGMRKDSSHEGRVMIDYANGQEQELALRADVLHPWLLCRTEYGQDIRMIDFGTVRVGCQQRKAIVLQNASQPEASWTATAEGHNWDQPGSAFRMCSVRSGKLEGYSHPTKMQAQQKLEFEFCPNAPGRHSIIVTFHVARGRDCQCELTGIATFDENDEPDHELLALP